MFSQNQRLSLRQGRALLLLSAWGPSVLILPRLLWEAGGPNGWQLLVGAALPVFVLLWLTVRRPGESPFSLFPTPARRGSFSRRLLALLLAVKQMAAAGLLLRFVAPLVQAQLLPRTPPVVPVLLLLLCALYPLSKGLEVRGRLAEVLCVLVFFSQGSALIILSLKNTYCADISNYEFIAQHMLITIVIMTVILIANLFKNKNDTINGVKRIFDKGCMVIILLYAALFFFIRFVGNEMC